MTSVTLLKLVIFFDLLLFVVHIIGCRFAHARGGPRSPQGHLLQIVFLLNVLLLISVFFAGRTDAVRSGELMLMMVYAFLGFNGFAYGYFHLFNATETARRTRMMIEIKRRGSMKEDELEKLYSPRHMLVVRLDRLIRFGEIFKGPDGRYRIKGHFLLTVAQIIQIWRLIAGYREPGESID